jgi:allantoin racemase
LKILCINPNSSLEITESIKDTCYKYALPNTKVEVKFIKKAPRGIESYLDAVISEKYLLEKFKEWKEPD